MAWNEPQVPTRSSRNQKNRMNRILNWAIGIVCLAILIVGGYLLSQVIHPSGKTTSSSKINHTNQSATKTVGASATTKAGSSKSSGSTNSNSSSTSNTSSGTDATTSSSDSSNTDGANAGSTSDSVSNTNAAYHFVGGGINGPWSPIGTVQSEPHQTSYAKGEIDWNEQIKALLYATNINDNDYIIWWLGNGGSSDSSKAIISTKEAPNQKYDVMLQWITNKGWEPTSVTLESASNSKGNSNASDSGTSSSNGSAPSN